MSFCTFKDLSVRVLSAYMILHVPFPSTNLNCSSPASSFTLCLLLPIIILNSSFRYEIKFYCSELFTLLAPWFHWHTYEGYFNSSLDMQLVYQTPLNNFFITFPTNSPRASNSYINIFSGPVDSSLLTWLMPSKTSS